VITWHLQINYGVNSNQRYKNTRYSQFTGAEDAILAKQKSLIHN